MYPALNCREKYNVFNIVFGLKQFPEFYSHTASIPYSPCSLCVPLITVVLKPVLEPPFIESYQRVCTYNMTRLVTVKLPNCKPNIDSTYTYPVALRCACGFCLTSTTECITSV
uniref:Glycoprotein hormone subunit beta 5 n=1 Tax=Fundulus heteroclitus TaxID=8078 RepID=A0A3Q2U6E7_FUNHE